MSNWSIEILNISNGGFAPAWYKETYPSYGNKNQAGDMANMDLTNPGYILQGPGLATLTNGTQAGAVTTLIKGMTDFAVTSDTAYGTGGNLLYQFSSTAVATGGIFPHTIDKAAVTAELGEDVCYYKGDIYYSYNHSGSAGDIGKYNLASTFDDDWGSTVPTGKAALESAPHQMIAGGNDVMYITNGIYIASWDGTTFIPEALDLPTGSVIQSVAWNNDKVWVSAINPNLTGANKVTGSIYVWDGVSSSWDFEIKMMGNVGGLFVKSGVLFTFFQDITSTGGYKIGYYSDGIIVDVGNYSGGLPAFYQITDYKDYITWNSNGKLFSFGSGDKDLPTKLFQLADGGFATVGGLVCPFGTPIVASNLTTSYKLAKFSGLDVAASWKSLMFDITGAGRISKVNNIRINFEKLAADARVDWKLVNNQGITVYNDTISYDKLGTKTTAYYPVNGKVTENFRIELDYANGDTTNSVNIKNVKIYGEYN